MSESENSDESDRGPGRPRVEVDTEAIRGDLAAEMSIGATADKHGFSRRTLRRRLEL